VRRPPRKRRQVHDLEAESLVTKPPVVEPFRPRGRLHHLRLAGQSKLGQPKAFTPERVLELQSALETWARGQPGRYRGFVKDATNFVRTKLRPDECGPPDGPPDSTLQSHIVRPVLARVFPTK
jgi:hypothetical protein